MPSAHHTTMCRLSVRNRNALGLHISPSAFLLAALLFLRWI
jgi:hypothetical protein